MNTSAQFPDTKYMGSKRTLLPVILEQVRKLRPSRVLDAFSGSGCVSYGLKTLGVQVHSNDFMKFASTIAEATITNNGTVLTPDDIRHLLSANSHSDDFVQRTFGDLYFDDSDNRF